MPDLMGVDIDPQTTGEVDPSSLFRRQQGFFVEINWDKNEDPMPKKNISSRIKRSCAQAADYAGIQFCARPFNIFTIGLVIFSSEFRVGIFDRAGIQFSPSYSLWGPKFICVMRRLTCDMDSYAMGMDPTVKFHPGSTLYSLTYPKFIVGLGGPTKYSDRPGQITRTTSGYPIWTSLSLIGRGTAVWQCEDGSLLKVAWRKQGRSREADIYQRVDIRRGVGIAHFVDGGDVHAVTFNDGIPISTNFIRDVIADKNARKLVPQEWNRVLHRVLINPIGKPLHAINSVNELAGGLQDIARGTCDYSITFFLNDGTKNYNRT